MAKRLNDRLFFFILKGHKVKKTYDPKELTWHLSKYVSEAEAGLIDGFLQWFHEKHEPDKKELTFNNYADYFEEYQRETR